MLWIVATPIGNLGDISRRAQEVLASVDVVLAEDTRRTGLLFSRLGLASPSFMSVHEHNEQQRIEQVVAFLGAGKHVALVSDAGTPLLADPGYRLVRACRERGLPVSPIPGASAILAALSASGLPPYPFTFLGFPPRKASERLAMFQPFATVPTTLVFFERGSRVGQTLHDAHAALGERDCCLARELTKLHEAFMLTTLTAWRESPQPLKGEVTVVVGPPREEADARPSDAAEVDALLATALAEGAKPRQAAKEVMPQVTGWTAKELYERVARIKEQAASE